MTVVFVAPLISAALALAACGGDSPNDTSMASKATNGNAVQVTAAKDGSFAYDQESVEAEPGSVEIDFDNPTSTPHDVHVEGPDGDVGGTEIVTGSSASTTLQLDPGEYTFYCSVPGHRESGMQGTLKVE